MPACDAPKVKSYTVVDANKKYIKIRDVATGPAGERVSLKIYNTSVYVASGLEVDAAGIDNKFNHNLFQINLRPFFNENQTDNTVAQTTPFGGAGSLGSAYDLLLPGLKHLAMDSRYVNNVQLFYMFVNEATEAPIMLEEFFIVFYDFDQDHADGNRSFVREALIITGFDVMFVNKNTSLEYTFSNSIPIFMATGGLSIRTVIDLDSNYEPSVYGTKLQQGVAIRSTQSGTGPGYAIKEIYERCEGLCSVPETLGQCTIARYRSSWCNPDKCGPNAVASAGGANACNVAGTNEWDKNAANFGCNGNAIGSLGKTGIQIAAGQRAK